MRTMVNTTVLFFATIKERTDTAKLTLELPVDANVLVLKKILKQKFPQAAQIIDGSIVSVNKEFAFDEDLIQDGAEIALFPPVSGGANNKAIIKITSDAIDINQLLEQITSPSNGAACVFTGLVRGITSRGQAHVTEYLFYEAYLEMAEAKMLQVAEEIRSRWPEVEGIAIVQRIGRLLPATPTVLIACTAAHRDTGVFEAARYGIDRLKEIVPVWKKEFGPDGEEWVEGEYRPQRGDR